MNAWDELLAATRPGGEVEVGADTFLVVSRRYHREEDDPTHLDRLTLTVELVRARSDADPWRLPADAPTPRHHPEEH